MCRVADDNRAALGPLVQGLLIAKLPETDFLCLAVGKVSVGVRCSCKDLRQELLVDGQERLERLEQGVTVTLGRPLFLGNLVQFAVSCEAVSITSRRRALNSRKQTTKFNNVLFLHG